YQTQTTTELIPTHINPPDKRESREDSEAREGIASERIFVSRHPDPPPLLGVVIEDRTESGKGESFNAMTVTAHDCRGHGQCVENRFFRGFNRRHNQWVQVCVGQVQMLKRRLFGIMGNDVSRGKSQHEIATAVARGGACACQSQRGTFRQSRELAAIERSIGGDDNDDGTLTLAW